MVTVRCCAKPVGADPWARASPGYFVFILFSFTQQNRTFAFQSRYRWLPPPCPGPTSRPLQEGLPPRRPPAGRCRRWSFGKDAPGRGRTCPSLAPKQPGLHGFLWYLRKQMQPHLRQALCRAWHCPARFLEDGLSSKTLLGRRPAPGRWPAACEGPTLTSCSDWGRRQRRTSGGRPRPAAG